MNQVLLLLIVAYVFIAVLLVLSLIKSQVNWKTKLALVTVTTVFYYVSYHAWSQAQGWPSQTKPPMRFVLHHALVVEPDQDEQTEGEILVWLSDIKGQKLANTPRAHRLEYSKIMHSRIEKALNKLKGGKAQIGTRGGQERKFQSELSGSVAEAEDMMIVFSDLPDLALPEK